MITCNQVHKWCTTQTCILFFQKSQWPRPNTKLHIIHALQHRHTKTSIKSILIIFSKTVLHYVMNYNLLLRRVKVLNIVIILQCMYAEILPLVASKTNYIKFEFINIQLSTKPVCSFNIIHKTTNEDIFWDVKRHHH